MRWFKNLSVRQKIAVSTFVVVAFITGVSWLIFQLIVFPTLSREIRSRGLTIAQGIAARAQRYLTANDHPNLLEVIFTEKWMEPNLLYVFVLDPSQQVVAHTFLTPFPAPLIESNLLPPGQSRHTRLVESSMGSVYDTALGVYEGIHLIATIRVGLSKGSVEQVINPLVQILLGVLTLVVTIALFLSSWFSRQITGPITQLSDLAGEVSRGNFREDASLRGLEKCWERKGCDLSTCPAYHRGTPPCWLRDDVPGRGGTLAGPVGKPPAGSLRESRRESAGDRSVTPAASGRSSPAAKTAARPAQPARRRCEWPQPPRGTGRRWRKVQPSVRSSLSTRGQSGTGVRHRVAVFEMPAGHSPLCQWKSASRRCANSAIGLTPMCWRRTDAGW